MAEKSRHDSDIHEHEHRLEEELVGEHVEEEKLERALEEVHEREEKTEEELEKEHQRTKTHFFLVFIINGEDFTVKAHVDEQLRVAVEKALVESGNTGRRDPSEWEVRNSEGVLLEMAREIRGLGLEDGARLFLSLKVGAGGVDASRW